MTSRMSKITFRADDDLIDRLEEFDASKSEVMRDALRTYLDGGDEEPSASVTDTDSIDELITDRVDAIIAERLDERLSPSQPQDINVNIDIDGKSAHTASEEARRQTSDDRVTGETVNVSQSSEGRKTSPDSRETPGVTEESDCVQCGETLAPSHVYCPNCGEKASHRVFCDCGDEVRSDWGFCPGCGRRTPAADVLDRTESGVNRE